tara:strand:+ start:76 stop:327 length:252 start_codon:yes stop_codon:yes gene_type:complete
MVSHEIAIKNINYLLPSTSTYTQGTWLGLLFFGGNAGETYSCKTSILGGGGQKIAAVRLLRYCSHNFSHIVALVEKYFFRCSV